MGYFKLLGGSVIICFPLNIPKKLHGQHIFEKPGEAKTHCLYLSEYNTIPMHHEEQHPPFKQTGNTTIFSFGQQSCTRSNPFCRQNQCSSCSSGIDWLLLLNILSFNFLPTLKKFLRLKRFRKSCANRPDVVLTNHKSYTAFWLDVLFSVVTFLFFASVCSQCQCICVNYFC